MTTGIAAPLAAPAPAPQGKAATPGKAGQDHRFGDLLDHAGGASRGDPRHRETAKADRHAQRDTAAGDGEEPVPPHRRGRETARDGADAAEAAGPGRKDRQAAPATDALSLLIAFQEIGSPPRQTEQRQALAPEAAQQAEAVAATPASHASMRSARGHDPRPFSTGGEDDAEIANRTADATSPDTPSGPDRLSRLLPAASSASSGPGPEGAPLPLSQDAAATGGRSGVSSRGDPAISRHQPDAPQADPPAGTAKQRDADTVSMQSFPAPAAYPATRTAPALAAAIAADGSWQQASALPGTPVSAPSPTHVLRIELHPAELGSVTASLRLSGEQLTIELKPDSHDGYRRLASDSDAIVKSLRSLGFDIDKVTILQPSIAAAPASRSDAPAAGGRDMPSFQPGGSDAGGNGANARQQPGGDNGNHRQDLGQAGPVPRERAGGGLFI